MPHKTVSLIETLLSEHNISYKKFEHEEVRTSEEAAAIRPDYTITQGAKALIVRTKKNGETQFVQLVVPGNKKFNTKKVKELLNVHDMRFATSEEVSEITDGIVPGGVPPFGILWNIPVYCDESLLVNDEIIFNAGDRGVSIALKTKEYEKLVQPIVAQFAEDK